MISFAKQNNLDPLLPQTWYSLARKNVETLKVIYRFRFRFVFHFDFIIYFRLIYVTTGCGVHICKVQWVLAGNTRIIP